MSNDARQASPLKRALLALEKMQARLDAVEAAKHEPVAIIGAGCRFPGNVTDLDTFWQLLRSGIDAVTEVPADRWDIDAYFDPDPDAPGKMYTRWGAFLDRVDRFDPQFFGITPREAVSMDPQQRLLLEVTWEALENAAQAPDRLQGSRTGVFIGILGDDYGQLRLADGGSNHIDPYYGSGVARSIASGRLSYVLGLRGPSVSIDTACSSSLVAIHQAVQSLRSGECALALAGGVNVMLTPEPTIALSKHKMMSKVGRCQTFDAAADGYVRGEGAGIVVLKRLSAARRDGDTILAVIRGTAVNQDGASSGLTAPNGPAQEDVIRRALQDARVNPADVAYVECHGTGTSLGDPIEVQALGAALGHGRSSDNPLLIGSVKTNLGHLETAAGVAGLLKLVGMLTHRTVPPHLHLTMPNPFIPWDNLPISVPTSLTPWPVQAKPIAGLSSFGFSGTNVHMILEAAPEVEETAVGDDERPYHLLTLSAKTDAARRDLTAAYRAYLAAHDRLPDAAYTANTGRAALPHRLAVTAANAADAAARLTTWLDSGTAQGVVVHQVPHTDPPKIAFLFTGQGAQYAGMGRQLYTTEPIFRQALDQCDTLLRPYLDRPLLDVLFADDEETAALINQTAYTQPALFAIEYALAQLWLSWNVRPNYVLGHSVGEYVAACLAGVFSLEDGLKLIAARGRLMQALPAGGAMAALFTDEDTVATAIAPHAAELSIAAVNGPTNIVISGTETAVTAVTDQLQQAGVKSRRLVVSHAFHSPLMEPMLADFAAVAAEITYHPPQLRLISNVSGKLATAETIATPAYWRDHVRAAVQFAPAVQTLYASQVDILLEVGPQPTLLGMARRMPAPADGYEPAALPSLRQNKDDWPQLLNSLAQLWTLGVAVDWQAFDAPYPRQKLRLPTYPFQRKRYWIPERPSQPLSPLTDGVHPVHPLLGRRLRSALRQVQYENVLTADSFGFIRDHQVQHTPLLPMTAYLEMALAAAAQHFGAGNHQLVDVIIHKPMVFADGAARAVQLIVTPHTADSAAFELFSQPEPPAADDDWRLHATGQIQKQTAAAAPDPTESTAAIRERLSQTRQTADHYTWLQERGFHFGPAMHGVEQVWWGENEALGEIALPAATPTAEPAAFHVHPALLDSCLQFFGAAVSLNSGDAYLPISLGQFRLVSPPGDHLFSHITIQPGADADTLNGAARLLGEDGRLVAELTDIAFRRTTQQALLRALGVGFADWYVEMVWQPDDKPAVLTLNLPEMSTEAEALLSELSEKHELTAYQKELFPQLEQLSADYVAAALQQLGWQMEVGQNITAVALQKELGIVPRYGRFLSHLLGIMTHAGWLQATDDGWRVVQRPVPADLEQRWQAILDAYPHSAAQTTLTGKCGRELAAVLTGRQDPLALLFPGGSVDVAEQLYRQSPQARVFNEMVATAVTRAVAQLPVDRPVHMLEIGAGTGGTTSAVLPVLPASRTTYTFTDIGPLFLSRAAERFAQYDFVQYQTLDIERDPAGQGFANGAYDVILAVNVLHATADLTETLTHVHQLLASGGLLILVEGTGPENWVDITFGLTDGWWRFRDTNLRRYPLIDRQTWRNLLAKTGFGQMAALPSDEASFRQDLILAQATPQTEPGHWLILADGGSIGQQVADRLAAQGETTTLVPPPNPDTVPDAAQMANWLDAGQRPLRGVVHLWSLDLPAPADVNSLLPWQAVASGTAVSLLQALGKRAQSPRLWLVTRGAQPVAPGDAPVPAQASLWGLSKVVDLEHPELRTVRIDLDPTDDDSRQAEAIFAELWQPDAETYVAYRQEQRHYGRLVPGDVTLATAVTGAAPVRLQKSPDGVLDDMMLVPVARVQPGPGQVEIRVHATGLNFRDVMNALAMRDDPDPLGGECSGVVTAVGPDVTGFAIGDAVMAMAPGSFGAYVLANVAFVATKPDHLSFAEAAALPIAYFTAYYSLHSLGQLQAGDSVLIHAASGGVGMAAVRLAQRAGATVYATASEPKWAQLRALGVDHIYNSRTLDFAGAIQADTNGRGVDVILNSLAGDFVDKSVAVLAKNGRFLEIGKRDIWTPEQFAAARPDATYHLIDLAVDTIQQPAAVGPIFAEVMTLVQAGELAPSPIKTFTLGNVADAFRFMSQTRHVGKIVVIQPDAAAEAAVSIRPDAAYLITGGLAGLGLLTAEHLAAQGARHLVLMGRSQPGEAAMAAIAALRDDGVQVTVANGDVTSLDDITRILDDIAANMPPLRGIIHSAGVLDDATLLRQTWDKFTRVMAPKIDGAWLLHSLTQTLPLDFFVLYSSTSAVTGSPGQANHAAANAFMDALAHYRQAQGRPALSINWGVWSRVGSAAERQADAWVAAQGARTIAPEQGLAVLDELMAQPKAQIGVLPIAWDTYVKQFEQTPAWLSTLARPAARRLPAQSRQPQIASATPDAEATAVQPAILQTLAAAAAAQRHDLLLNHVSAQVVTVIGLDAAHEVDPDLPLSDMGLDSLMAVELRNLLGSSLALTKNLPATLVFDYPTVTALTNYLLPVVLPDAALDVDEAGQAAAATPSTEDLLANIEDLSDEDVERLFAELQEE